MASNTFLFRASKIPCSYGCQSSQDQDQDHLAYQNIQEHISLGVGMTNDDLEGLAAFSLAECRFLGASGLVRASFAIDELAIGEFVFSLGLFQISIIETG